jgi:hypothetical protein
MTTPDPLAEAIAGCLNTITRVGNGPFLQLRATPAKDGLSVTLEVRPIGFDTIGDQSRTVLLRLGSPDTNGTVVDPVIARGDAA